jgi:hypothetical protein
MWAGMERARGKEMQRLSMGRDNRAMIEGRIHDHAARIERELRREAKK